MPSQQLRDSLITLKAELQSKPSGEDYHKRYREIPEAFSKLTKAEVSLERSIKRFQRGLVDKLPTLVDVQSLREGKAKLAPASVWTQARGELEAVLLKELEAAHALGLVYGEAQLKVPVDLTVDDPDVQDILRERARDTARSVIRTFQKRLKAKIKTTQRKLKVQADDFPFDINGELVSEMESVTKDDTKAETIGRTEIIAGIMAILLLYAVRAGARKKTWRTVAGAESICADLSGQTVGLDEDFDSLVGSVNQPPDPHPRCILPGTTVTSPKVLATMKSTYDGPCVEICLANGRKLSVTKNHLILTSKGFVPAYAIGEGDDVLCADRPENIFSQVDPYNYQGEALIEDVVRAFSMSSKVAARSVPATTEHLHGDGAFVKGNVDIVWTDGLLGRRAKAKMIKPAYERPLVSAHSRAGLLAGLRSLALLSKANLTTSNGIMSGLRIGLPFFRGHVPHSDKHTIGDVSRLNASSEDMSSESTPADANLLRKFMFRFAADITLQNVVKVRNFNYSGHVFDLSVNKFPYYTGNSIITHNCRCYLDITQE